MNNKKKLISLIILIIFIASPLATGAQNASFAASQGDVLDVVSGESDGAADNSATTGGSASTDESAAIGDSAAASVPADPGATPPDAPIVQNSPAAPVSSDLSASYADLTQAEKAEILSRLGMLKGDPNIGLMLDIKVRRSDAAVFFTRLLGREQYVVERAQTDFAVSRFPDAVAGQWYTPYISYCTSIGLVAGRTDGYYYPDDNISEKEFANVLLKILGYEYQVDYNWDTVYEFSYDVGLFDNPDYASRTEDNREYFRRDVCDQVFAVLGLEKKDSPKLLIEELVENGAIPESVAADLGFDLSGLGYSQTGEDGGYDDSVDADILEINHIDSDLLWIVFTKPISFQDDAIEISQTYDYSKILTTRVEDKTARDMLLRTGEQQPNMDYTIDISNVLEPDGTNAGILSFDFVGYDPSAPRDAPAGLTTRVRDVDNLPGANGGAASGDPSGASASGSSSSGGTTSGDPSGDQPSGADVQNPSGGSQAGQTSGSGATSGSAGNADPSVDYFRVVNAYTTASNELVVYFSQPVTETAASSSLYNIVQGGAILASGSAGQITAEIVENTVNAVRLTVSGMTFTKGSQYRATVSGRLTSSYTARLNEGAEDSYSFSADNVAERSDGFILKSVNPISQYAIELEFSQAVSAENSKLPHNYLVLDQNNRKLDISVISVIPDSVASAGAGAADGKVMRINLLQPLLTNQNCSMTVIYAQNANATASIVNQSYQFQYGGQGESQQKSAIALTGAISNDPSTAELYFSHKLDPVSAVATSNYTVVGTFGGKSYTINPVKVSYDPILTPYMVRLYFQSDRSFVKDQPYSIRISNMIRDEKKMSPDRSYDMQFFSNNLVAASPAIKDAVIVGGGIVRVEFTKEILFDPARISEGNFALIDASAPASTVSQPSGYESVVTPVMVKYINSTTLILKFDEIDMSKKYRVYFNSLSDFSGQFTTRYPEQGSSIALRNGKR